jgi:hypothetical protein
MTKSMWGLAIAAILSNILGFFLGFEGVARIHRLHLIPFNDGMQFVLSPFPSPPNWLVYAWAYGWFFICLIAFALPSFCVIYLIRRERYFLGWTLLAITTLCLACSGAWLWFYAVFNEV